MSDTCTGINFATLPTLSTRPCLASFALSSSPLLLLFPCRSLLLLIPSHPLSDPLSSFLASFTSVDIPPLFLVYPCILSRYHFSPSSLSTHFLLNPTSLSQPRHSFSTSPRLSRLMRARSLPSPTLLATRLPALLPSSRTNTTAPRQHVAQESQENRQAQQLELVTYHL